MKYVLAKNCRIIKRIRSTEKKMTDEAAFGQRTKQGKLSNSFEF